MYQLYKSFMYSTCNFSFSMNLGTLSKQEPLAYGEYRRNCLEIELRFGTQQL